MSDELSENFQVLVRLSGDQRLSLEEQNALLWLAGFVAAGDEGLEDIFYQYYEKLGA